jgi:hypothetical protein
VGNLKAISRQLLMTLDRVLAGENLLHLVGEIQIDLLSKRLPREDCRDGSSGELQNPYQSAHRFVAAGHYGIHCGALFV